MSRDAIQYAPHDPKVADRCVACAFGSRPCKPCRDRIAASNGARLERQIEAIAQRKADLVTVRGQFYVVPRQRTAAMPTWETWL